MPGGGSLNPATHHTIDAKYHYLKMQGNEVFKHAVQVMGDISEKLYSPLGRSNGCSPSWEECWESGKYMRNGNNDERKLRIAVRPSVSA